MQTHFSDSATVQGHHHQCLKLLRADFAPYFTTRWTLTEHCKESQVVFIVSWENTNNPWRYIWMSWIVTINCQHPIHCLSVYIHVCFCHFFVNVLVFLFMDICSTWQPQACKVCLMFQNKYLQRREHTEVVVFFVFCNPTRVCLSLFFKSDMSRLNQIKRHSSAPSLAHLLFSLSPNAVTQTIYLFTWY